MSQRYANKTVMEKDHWRISMRVFHPSFVEYRLWHQCLDEDNKRTWWHSAYTGFCSKCGEVTPDEIVELKKDLEYLQKVATG